MHRLAVAVSLVLLSLTLTAAATARVLRVGTYHHIKGQYKSIQAAVDAAKPGDWILIGPGDYKTTSTRVVSDSASSFPAGVLVTKAHLRIRGMNRNSVIVDGTKSGPACSNAKADQNFGPTTSSGPGGLNGIMVYKANDVWVQNLTSCNFLGGADDAGNEVWWNGGANTGGATQVSIGGWGYLGTYLNATNTYFQSESNAAQYGIFSSNWSGGTWDQTYSSNFNDSGYYIGACGQVCDQTVNHAWSEFNVLGYSGSNSGGQLVIENSQFDQNQDGFDTNSQNGDNPPPQDGACPGNGTSPITHTHSCWVFMHNYVHDNNNPNVPGAGTAAQGPVGTGASFSGARNDTIIDNRFVNNEAWGLILVPYPDSGPPCTGGTGGQQGSTCLYDEWGDAVLNNSFTKNGGYGNPTNGDIALTNLEPGPTNCFSGNVDTSGTLTSAPSDIQSKYPTCNGQTVPPSVTDPNSFEFTNEVQCDSGTSVASGPGTSPCAPTDKYPRRTKVVMHPLPPASKLPTMANPCSGAPKNPWCPASKPKHKQHRKHK